MSKTPRNRTYSKRLTAWSLVGIFGLAAEGLWTGNPVTADIIGVVGSTSIAHLLLYMGVGHLDYRTLLTSSLLDLRKKGHPDG